jgi:hypothetical protein
LENDIFKGYFGTLDGKKRRMYENKDVISFIMCNCIIV